jgi:4-hydroxy-tetrahydrodipicolinate synthase
LTNRRAIPPRPICASIRFRAPGRSTLYATFRLDDAEVAAIRATVPEHVTIGVSGDASAATGLSAGCDAWYSVIGGTLPGPAMTITRAALDGRPDDATAESERLAPLWDLFAEFGGSLRVVAAIAEHLGLASTRCLPLPVQGLTDAQRARVADVVDELGLE